MSCGVLGAVGAYAWSAPPLARLRSEQGELPRAYDAQAIADFWETSGRFGCVLSRGAQVGAVLLPFIGRVCRGWYTGRLGGARAEVLAAAAQRQSGEATARDRDAEAEAQRSAASELRAVLTALGPAFIKLGQVLSTRPDLLPAPVLDELRQLCDAVPPYPTDEAIAVIEGELGAGAVARMFEGLNANTLPVAGASLGQVYKVRLKGSGDGEEGIAVALKVQRPDALLSVALDLYLLRHYAVLVEAAKEMIGGAAERVSQAKHWWREHLMEEPVTAAERSEARYASSPVDNRPFRFRQQKFDVLLVEAFAAASYQELDYEAEADNQAYKL